VRVMQLRGGVEAKGDDGAVAKKGRTMVHEGRKNQVSILGHEAGRRGREGGPRGGAASDGRNLSR
jgi:hypothetical protein